MKTYNIEGGINFFDELYKSLDDENDNITDDSNICLISNKPLIDKFIELKCGHKFNYVELYKDLVNHIVKFNSLEGSNSRLKPNEIRCPYCRNKQIGVLPYYEELGLKGVPGVNVLMKMRTIDNSNSRFSKCEYLTINPTFDISGNDPVEQGYLNSGLNCKFYKCNNFGTKINNYEDEKHYCWSHKKLVVKEYKKEKALKIKLEAKKAKEEIKLKAKEAKEEEKKKQKEEKEKMKEELKKLVMEAKANKKVNKKPKKSNDENIVIGTINVVLNENVIDSEDNNDSINVCEELLKSGTNKGKVCGCKLFSDNLCKRHYNLKNKMNEK